jgi:maltooligosyltrehalose trehalohydrolase
MGEEYDETNPFLYFVSHGDEELIESVRKGRREEFKAFGWGDEVPDPQAEETFLRSRLDRTRSSTAEGSAMLALYRALLKLRREERALRPGDADVVVEHDEAAAWVRLTLTPHTAGAAPLIVLFNLSAERRELSLAAEGTVVPAATRILATDDPGYAPGGKGRGNTEFVQGNARVAVGPSAAAVFKVEPRK